MNDAMTPEQRQWTEAEKLVMSTVLHWANGHDGRQAILRAFEILDAEHKAKAKEAEDKAFDWKPIETAPKGQKVLMIDKDGFIKIQDWGLFCKYNAPGFSHWMPLPKPPAVQDAMGKERKSLP